MPPAADRRSASLREQLGRGRGRAASWPARSESSPGVIRASGRTRVVEEGDLKPRVAAGLAIRSLVAATARSISPQAVAASAPSWPSGRSARRPSASRPPSGTPASRAGQTGTPAAPRTPAAATSSSHRITRRRRAFCSSTTRKKRSVPRSTRFDRWRKTRWMMIGIARAARAAEEADLEERHRKWLVLVASARESQGHSFL